MAGAVVVVRAASGAEVARATTDASGAFAATLPAGDYVIEPQPVTGLMGTPAAQPVTVAAGRDRDRRARLRHGHPAPGQRVLTEGGAVPPSRGR